MTRFSEEQLLSEKVIADPVHGYIRMNGTCIDIVDTPQFQRLRDLKQMGASYYVFPGASHSRFEHSIGVSYIAGELVSSFRRNQPDLDINDSDVQCVQIAGLCHDLGHGPFSHMFDSVFIPKARPGVVWKHETASENMLDYLIDDNGLDIDSDDVKFIKDLIRGEASLSGGRDGKKFLFDIVANKRNSVDVDKFDYIARDCYNLGESISYDSSRLMQFSRVIDDQICYYHKEVYNLYELFNTRYSLFKRIYTHRVACAIEHMLTDALLAADPYLKLSDAIDDMEQYSRLTDHVIRTIEFSKEDKLASARAIIQRIRKRQLYRFVEERMIPAGSKAYMKNKINALAICSHQSEYACIKEDDIIVDWLTVGYGFNGKNPVDSIKFYSKFQDESFHIPREQVSFLAPENFEEAIVRIYARDPKHVKAIQEAFQALMLDFEKHKLATSPNPGDKRPAHWSSSRKRRYTLSDEECTNDSLLTIDGQNGSRKQGIRTQLD
ncbi:HD phosphohydrolase domain-containing protein [Syncephalis plumigaleata]|nr:HD phosphohydrolase domain-containing protein [Syncephalis plumigaleata]